ncbi:MAG: beta-propeller fold lactonase family protein, partial [Streptococcus sp.]|nr:beta-propeller fold lactonase family protein [Streptococcus sp.]
YTFSVDAKSGLLTLVQTVDSYGSVPRDFNLSNDETYIVVGHQESDNLTLFKRDLESGQLTLLQKDFYAPEVVCVVPQ